MDAVLQTTFDKYESPYFLLLENGVFNSILELL